MTGYECKIAEHPLDATVQLPGSKSITNRALVAAALADGHSVLGQALLADVRVVRRRFRAAADQEAEAKQTGEDNRMSHVDLSAV